MFKKILDFFSGRSAERGLSYTERFKQPEAPYKIETPSPQAESIKAAVEAKVAEPVAKKPATKRQPAKKTAAKPKK
jgi:hypothetical protein